VEKNAWREHDPVEWFRGELLKNNILTDDEIAGEWETARKKIAKVTMLAANSRDPSVKNIHFGVSIDTSSEHLDHDHKTKKLFKSPRKIPRDSQGQILARHAVLEALTEEMIRDERVVLWGEDVAEQGGAYSTTLGLLEIDFILQAMDQVGNQAAKARFMFGGQFTVPLTIRATIGGGKGYAGQHSQSLEAVVTHFPGLRVVAPSNAYDMKGLLKTAIRDDNPVFFVEHQMVYLEKGVVPENKDYTVPIGKASVVRKGQDITVIAYSNMVSRTLAAAEILEKEDGIGVEVVDPRTLVPLDVGTISYSVRRTGRAAIVVQANYTGSFASHISHENLMKYSGTA
jgi:2-oxoisovalerate dehydrogenase E1 component